MVDGPVRSRPGIVNDVPESMIQVVRDRRLGCHGIISLCYTVERIALI